jgi:hypothetical protein
MIITSVIIVIIIIIPLIPIRNPDSELRENHHLSILGLGSALMDPGLAVATICWGLAVVSWRGFHHLCNRI